MEDWIRIDDDELATFGKLQYKFAFSADSYSITIDPAIPDYLIIEYQGKFERWPIEMKHRKHNEFRISGFADWVPELMATWSWFELFLDDDPKIIY
ncbi:MAG: hypothetical protein COB78_10935 [Hyphomicrobiales bacterium]|nr:MAG: hypothetical protein COB78_10935 [Hyphomicrobiales bacterium]